MGISTASGRLTLGGGGGRTTGRTTVGATTPGAPAYPPPIPSRQPPAAGIIGPARGLGMPAVIVMPSDAPRVKRDATLALGAEVVPYDRKRENREKIASHGIAWLLRIFFHIKSFDGCWVVMNENRFFKLRTHNSLVCASKVITYNELWIFFFDEIAGFTIMKARKRSFDFF